MFICVRKVWSCIRIDTQKSCFYMSIDVTLLKRLDIGRLLASEVGVNKSSLASIFCI